MPPYRLPALETWLANLAGIIPLSALIDFTDAPKTLHSYQLSGRGLFWNWVITPAAARLLISTEDQASSCCLDRPGATAPLYCLDGRWGDNYPCSNPFTLRTCVDVAKLSTSSSYTNPDVKGLRRQRLQIIRVSLHNKPSSHRTAIARHLLGRIEKFGWTWTIISALGWLLFLAVLAGCFLSAQYIAAAYLVVLPLTGAVIHCSHGSKARRLLNAEPSRFSRLVVMTESFNGNEWTAFIGPHTVVDSLLNKPLYQVDPTAYPQNFRAMLRVLVPAQWVLTTVACALQNWNALFVFAWIALCAVISSFVYSERSSVANWLKTNHVRLSKAELNFTSRRAMLSTLVALNPDRASTKWIDPILAPSQDRTDWEQALQEHLETGKCINPGQRSNTEVGNPIGVDVCVKEPVPYWLKFLVEGVEVTNTIKPWAMDHKEAEGQPLQA